ncbi:MAG: MarR family winged helix-turn-helix transcriptional regulator [Rhodothermales bacterium]
MRIEDAIEVQGFPSKQQKLSINLIYTTSWADVQHQEFFGEYDLTSSQYNVLRILRGHHPNPVTTSTIWQRMIHRNAGASRLVDRLIKKGLAQKSVCETDRRLVDVVITEKGLDVLAQMDAERHRIDEIYARLSEEEIDQLSDLLDKLRS